MLEGSDITINGVPHPVSKGHRARVGPDSKRKLAGSADEMRC